jgi:hypothetical protein
MTSTQSEASSKDVKLSQTSDSQDGAQSLGKDVSFHRCD